MQSEIVTLSGKMGCSFAAGGSALGSAGFYL
jgi:hypothetical protein